MAKVFLFKGKEKRVEYGHPWIFKSDIESISGSFRPGDAIEVYSRGNRFLGMGYINPKSQITVRMLSPEHEEINGDFFYRRISSAWDYRKKIADTQSCRVVFAESDFLPALIVDKFGDYLVVQTLAMGMDRHKEEVVEILDEIIKPAGIFERNDVPVRELEGLEQKKGYLKGHFDTKVQMVENGIKFTVDVENGQKTGFFLDQKENRAAIKPLVKGAKVLDCFSHTGSFALHAAYYGAQDVLGIDISAHAVEFAAHNARQNGLEHICRFETANAFDKLRELDDQGQKFDVVILDPPAFAKTRSAVEGAVRGYKEINLRAMKIISSGGFLVTCSCSHHVDPDLFMDIIYSSAIDAKRKVRLVEYRGQAKDHPVLLASEETQYLKCAILQVV
ncbi:MAG: class I SAM-dependent rRNA methyltransferase [Clostridiales bacterium]|jgi:23S rRNA (cytosine1962-C5)-methyltransferase|nr:class I SAM-dependent rRNA methyltransferase [Eubacteriales bacterium]MDH7564975.1 class I SAM-dependent rRNA methyltransferase [Clostridiales bacterium]